MSGPEQSRQQKRRFPGFQSPNYTAVPDELFDELLPELSGAELKVLLYIIRRTFGFKKDSDDISLAQMLNGVQTRDGRVLDRGVGLSKKTLLQALQSLKDQNIIVTTRQYSVEKGNEPTTYALNILPVRGSVETTPPLGEKLHQGVGEKLRQGVGGESTPSPWGKNYTTQETVKQETEIQDSNIRRAPHEEAAEDKEPDRRRTAPRRSAPTPLTNILERERVRLLGNSDRQISTTAKRASPPEAPEKPAEGEEPPQRDLGPPRKRPSPSYNDDRQALLAYLEDFMRELGDQAPLKSSVSRAHNLYHRSGLSLDAFIGKLYEARSITKERTGSIRSRGEGSGTYRPKNKAAYYFAVLEDLLGLADDQAKAVPPT